jgi:hypothetical protein
MTKLILYHMEHRNPLAKDAVAALVDIVEGKHVVYDVFTAKNVPSGDPEELPIGTTFMTRDEIKDNYILSETESVDAAYHRDSDCSGK